MENWVSGAVGEMWTHLQPTLYPWSCGPQVMSSGAGKKQRVGVGWLEGRRSLGSTDERSKLGVREAVIGDLQIWGCRVCIWGNRKKRIIIILI